MSPQAKIPAAPVSMHKSASRSTPSQSNRAVVVERGQHGRIGSAGSLSLERPGVRASGSLRILGLVAIMRPIHPLLPFSCVQIVKLVSRFLLGKKNNPATYPTTNMTTLPTMSV